MVKADMNQATEITVLSAEEFDKQYGITGRGRTSEFDIPMFYDAVELAKKNPQYYQPGVGVTENFELKQGSK